MSNRLGSTWLNQVRRANVGTYSARYGKFALLAHQVNGFEPELEALSDAGLKERSHQLRLRARQGDSLNGLLPEAFALVREAAKRTIGQRHYDVQLVGRCRHPLPLDRRDGNRRRQDARRHPARLPQRPARQGRARRHGQRLPCRARRRVDGRGLPLSGPDGRLHPDRPVRPRPPSGLRLRHHLRHRQGDGLRLPPRRAQAASDGRRQPPQDVRAGLPGPRRPVAPAICPFSGPTTSASWTRPTAS